MTNILKEQLSSDPDKVFNTLNSLKSWLSRSNGLGLQSVVEDILETIKTNVSDEEIEKYTIGANLLKDNGKISESTYNRFINDLPNKTLVYIDQKWHYWLGHSPDNRAQSPWPHKVQDIHT